MQEPNKENEYEKSEKIRINELESQNATLESECTLLRAENEMYEKKIRDIEEDQQHMYMVMFRKGQQAGQIEVQV